MTKNAALLGDRGVVKIDGEDAAGFLQGLLTNDVERLAVGEARYAALLTPQGKILFDMLVVRAPAGSGAAFLIDCAAGQAADLARAARLLQASRQGFGCRRELRARSRRPLGREPDAAPDALLYADPRDSRLGWRAILPRDRALEVGDEHAPTYEALRIGAGVPKGGVDFAYGDAFPQDANFDLLHGVDFAKGCYVGQEVVSRMKHRGTARKRVTRVKAAGEPASPGTPVLDGELAVGTLGSSSGREALAMLRLDRVDDAKAAGRELTAGGVGLALAE